MRGARLGVYTGYVGHLIPFDDDLIFRERRAEDLEMLKDNLQANREFCMKLILQVIIQNLFALEAIGAAGDNSSARKLFPLPSKLS